MCFRLFLSASPDFCGDDNQDKSDVGAGNDGNNGKPTMPPQLPLSVFYNDSLPVTADDSGAVIFDRCFCSIDSWFLLQDSKVIEKELRSVLLKLRGRVSPAKSDQWHLEQCLNSGGREKNSSSGVVELSVDWRRKLRASYPLNSTICATRSISPSTAPPSTAMPSSPPPTTKNVKPSSGGGGDDISMPAASPVESIIPGEIGCQDDDRRSMYLNMLYPSVTCAMIAAGNADMISTACGLPYEAPYFYCPKTCARC